MHSKFFTFLWSEWILGTNLVFDLSVQRRATIKTIFLKQVYSPVTLLLAAHRLFLWQMCFWLEAISI